MLLFMHPIIMNILTTVLSASKMPARCHQAGTGWASLEVIGSKWSYALNWCKLNDDDVRNSILVR